jgi:hypothetical protein
MTVAVWLRRVAFALLLLVITLAALTARMVKEGEAALSKSDAAFDRGDLRDAVLYARRAAVLYAPGAPHVPAAYARLTAVAVGAEAAGDADVARLAWGAMRGAALETRHVSTPHAADLERANVALARLEAPPNSPPAARSDALARLARDDAPRAPWVVVLGAGFALFCAGIVVAITRGVDPAGRVSAKGAWVAALLSLAGLVCWTLAVYSA